MQSQFQYSNMPTADTVSITIKKLVTESDLGIVRATNGVSIANIQSSLGLSYPFKIKVEAFSSDNTKFASAVLNCTNSTTATILDVDSVGSVVIAKNDYGTIALYSSTTVINSNIEVRRM